MKIPDLKEIALAWAHSMKPTPEQQAIADARLAICDTCEFKEFVKLTRFYKCNACGCPINKKVFSPSGADACPKGKWAV